MLALSLDRTIRPVVKWLGSPDAAQQLAKPSVKSSSRAKKRNALSSSSPGVSAAVADDKKMGARQQLDLDASEVGGDGIDISIGFLEDGGGGAATRRTEEEEGVVVADKLAHLEMPAYIDGKWEWGLGLGPKERNKVVIKQGDLLWKSVPGNLAKATAWFVKELGLSWDDMRKVSLIFF